VILGNIIHKARIVEHILSIHKITETRLNNAVKTAIELAVVVSHIVHYIMSTQLDIDRFLNVAAGVYNCCIVDPIEDFRLRSVR